MNTDGYTIEKNYESTRQIPKQLRSDCNYKLNLFKFLAFTKALESIGGGAAISFSSMMYGTMAANLAMSASL